MELDGGIGLLLLDISGEVECLQQILSYAMMQSYLMKLICGEMKMGKIDTFYNYGIHIKTVQTRFIIY